MIRYQSFPLGLAVVLAVGVSTSAEPKVLYEKQSPYNTIVVTEDDQGLRTLWFEKRGVRQSVVKVGDPDHLELAYARVMPAGMALVEKPQRVLIIGLGGGTIPLFLHKHYPETAIDVVDIDPDVVHVAKEFFGFREDRTLRALVADGRKFIEQCRDFYDLVFLDAFGSENIPYHLATREFLEATFRAVKPGGAVVGNVWSRYSNPLYDSMIRTYLDVFAELHILDVKGAGNKILLALPQRRHLTRDALARRASEVAQERHFGFDLGEAVLHGFQEPEKESFRADVLTDKK